MTNQINKTFGRAADQRGPELITHLVAIFEPLYKEDAQQVVGQAADWMGRNVEPASAEEPQHRRSDRYGKFK